MTIKDQAAKTGYAVGTVSRALNNHPNVSEKARRTILAAARESGFELNQNAKQLKQTHSNTILVVVKGIGNELFFKMVEFIQSLVSKTRYQLTVDYVDEDSNEVIRAIQLCREKKPLGILFLGGNSQSFRKDFEKIDIPCVLVTNDASKLGFPNLSSVSIDSQAAARCAVETLIGLGHTQFVIVGGDCNVSDTSRLRFEGCMQAFQAHNIPFQPKNDYRGVRFSSEDGYRAAVELLHSGGKFTALFAAADVMAIGAIRALWENGLRVPEDVSVIGMDGLPMGSYLIPQLSTVSQPAQTMALRSVEILLKAMEENAPPVTRSCLFSCCTGKAFGTFESEVWRVESRDYRNLCHPEQASARRKILAPIWLQIVTKCVEGRCGHRSLRMPFLIISGGLKTARFPYTPVIPRPEGPWESPLK